MEERTYKGMKSLFLYIGVQRVRTAYMSLQWGMGELLGWVVWRAWRGRAEYVDKGYKKDEGMEKVDAKTRFEKMMFSKTGSLKSSVTDQSEPA